MIQLIRNIVAYRQLLYILSQSYIKARYKQTILGVLWAVAQPLVLMIIVTLVLSNLNQGQTISLPYPIFAFIGFWVWALFSNSLSFAVPNLVQNSALLRKIYFPREILVIAAVVPSLLDFGLGFVVLLFLALYFNVTVTPLLIALPFFLLILLLFILGIAFLGSILNVAFRDVSKFLPISLQIIFFASPIIYPSAFIPEKYSSLINANPLTGVIEGMRLVIVNNTFSTSGLFYAFVASLVCCWIGYFVFKKGEQIIADIL